MSKKTERSLETIKKLDKLKLFELPTVLKTDEIKEVVNEGMTGFDALNFYAKAVEVYLDQKGDKLSEAEKTDLINLKNRLMELKASHRIKYDYSKLNKELKEHFVSIADIKNLTPEEEEKFKKISNKIKMTEKLFVMTAERSLETKGYFDLTPGFKEHHIVAKVERHLDKDEKEFYTYSLYNAGMELKKIDGKYAPKVTYKINKEELNEVLSLAIEKNRLSYTDPNYVKLMERYNGILSNDKIIDYKFGEPQRTGNCATRSTREFISDVIPEKTFKDFYAFVAGEENIKKLEAMDVGIHVKGDDKKLLALEFDENIINGNTNDILKKIGAREGRAYSSEQIDQILNASGGFKNPEEFKKLISNSLNANNEVAIIAPHNYPEIIKPMLEKLGLTKEELEKVKIVSDKTITDRADLFAKAMKVANITSPLDVNYVNSKVVDGTKLAGLGFNQIIINKKEDFAKLNGLLEAKKVDKPIKRREVKRIITKPINTDKWLEYRPKETLIESEKPKTDIKLSESLKIISSEDDKVKKGTKSSKSKIGKAIKKVRKAFKNAGKAIKKAPKKIGKAFKKSKGRSL